MKLQRHKITPLLLSCAGVAVLLPTLLAGSVASSDRQRRRPGGTEHNQKLILLRRGVIDTEARIDRDISQSDRVAHLDDRSAMSVSRLKRARIVQFVGPIKRSWIESLRAIGAEIVGYVPNYAYMIRGTAAELARVAELDGLSNADDTRPIRWMGRLLPIEKLDPQFTDEMLERGSGRRFDVDVELARSSDTASVGFINSVASKVNKEPRSFGNFVVLSVTLSSERLLEVAGLDDVLFIGPSSELRLNDECSAQIVAGNLLAGEIQPTGPGYLNWLTSKGLNTPTDYVVDFADSGLDRGSASPDKLHPDFLDSAQQSRVAYMFNYANDGQLNDERGHGTIVASVAAGRGTIRDELGYAYGLGVDPGARLGVSRIFLPDNGLPAAGLNFTNVAATAYSGGARISNNSWGNISNTYDSSAQEYDSLVRDAQPSTSGNQEMVFVFSVANAGPGYVGSPATAKNVISVAASENYRPSGTDVCAFDQSGEGVGPDGADNALDILRYSSGGPTADGRAKPDLAAPGTHVYGAASQTAGFFGVGLCAGPGTYRPPDQSLYTWSSGTSLAAPHVTGAASLLRRFFLARNLLGDNRAPSPAMTKAYLLNSASYMTGQNAGGDLPGERQGWGRLDLSRAFDGASRVLIDQTKLFSESGQTFEVQGSLASRELPLRATLAWSDAPGSLIGPALVNDLDLEISVGGITIYRGNNFAGQTSLEGGEPDRLNNVEAIYLPPDLIPAGAQGNITVTVRASNIAGDGVPGNDTLLDQDFALVIYNLSPITAPPPPPPNTVPVITGVTYVKKQLTISGHDFTAKAQVEINGKVINREFEFDATANSLGLHLKARKLNLSSDSDNQIVLIENGERSQAFNLRL